MTKTKKPIKGASVKSTINNQKNLSTNGTENINSALSSANEAIVMHLIVGVGFFNSFL